MLGVTLDTNIYVSALEFGGVGARLLGIARAGMFRIDVSDAILDELVTVLWRSNDPSQTTNRWPVALCYPRAMSQPVKLSDNLVLDARLAGQIEERSIAGQVEFWARLGRSVELLLEGQQVLTLCHGANVRPLSACLESVDSDAGRRRVDSFLGSQPFPHYQPHPDRPGMLVRVDADGQRTVGRFVNRQFRPVKTRAKR